MAKHRNGIVTLLTDFGTSGSYVGAMRGAVLARNPHARLVDITHEIPAQDVQEGARVLAAACPWFPPGTVHLAVVDPGVGTERCGLIVEAGQHLLVGPDNGLLAAAADRLGNVRSFRIDSPDLTQAHISATFHGRDVFGPVAGSLSAGEPLESLGEFLGRPAGPRPSPEPEEGEAMTRGEIVAVDHFGNLISNIRAAHLPGSDPRDPGLRVRFADRTLPVVRTYGDAEEAALVALVGSDGFLEVALVNGSAAESTGLGRGATIEAFRR